MPDGYACDPVQQQLSELEDVCVVSTIGFRLGGPAPIRALLVSIHIVGIRK